VPASEIQNVLQKHILFRFCDLNIVKMSVFLNVPANIQKVPVSGALTLAHLLVPVGRGCENKTLGPFDVSLGFGPPNVFRFVSAVLTGVRVGFQD
jgi:hypothetical protein